MQVEVTAFILSGTILKSLFAGIMMSEIVMRKLALKISMIPQKSEWLASLILPHLIDWKSKIGTGTVKTILKAIRVRI